MLQKKLEFINLKNSPINELFFQIKENGIKMKIPALSEHWSNSKHVFTKYHSLPIHDAKILETGAELDEWISQAEFFSADMKYLLELKYFEFWLTLIYNNQSIEAVISFLQEATPFYINLKELISINSTVINIYKDILNNVLRIICRMITNKESDSEWMTKEYLRDILYTKFLISIPMLYDLIIVYGKSNSIILKKIFDTIFVIEPKYFDDLKISMMFMDNSLKTVQQRIGEEVENPMDLSLYCLDCSFTLSILLEICPEARSICNEMDMAIKISNFYDNAIPSLYKFIYSVNPLSSCLLLINKTRLEFLKSFNLLISVYIEEILRNPEESILSSEAYIRILTECLVDHTFVTDYQNYFTIENDIDIMKQACKELDILKVDFILKTYTNVEESHVNEVIQNPIEQTKVNEIERFEEKLSSEFNRNTDEELSTVRDILPHLGEGFVRKLLLRYENPELAISAVLESNLPPDLIDADLTEPYIPPDPQDTLYIQTGIQRYNVYDGDQYDIMAKDNPSCVIKVGKGIPGQAKNMKELLNDKSHVNSLRDRYQQYSLVTEDNEYDDEYDDSYDALAESESKSTRKNIGKNELVDEIEESSAESSSDEVSKENSNANKDVFCENPEVTRARYEAKRHAKFANKHHPQKLGDIDLAGKPKGQGQDKKVLQERYKKGVHKSDRGNHNRKSGAAFKRNRGMIPS